MNTPTRQHDKYSPETVVAVLRVLERISIASADYLEKSALVEPGVVTAIDEMRHVICSQLMKLT